MTSPTHTKGSFVTETLPGSTPADAELLAKLAQAHAMKPSAYVPRTRHLLANGAARFTNRLYLETSPYLQQHAHNPVDWHPWGDEAFELARALGRPVLLSVGYSTCHWCHVMEEESFEDEEIAAYVNANYIPIKVDREERPDVDAIYMTSVQALTGRGGWPMTVWLTADRRPYYGGTYFPPHDGARGMRVGFLTILRELRRLATEDPERMERAAQQLVSVVEERLSGTAPGDLPETTMTDRAFQYYERSFDPDFGGLAQPPKFPATLPIRWLLRYYARTDNGAAKTMAEITLERMAAGGLRDHVGGGFHRYSVDEEWLVPHFEKMLYDNALLAQAYLEGYQVTGRQDFADVAAETLAYVARELQAPEGGFYAATDADSPNPERGGEREEGWYFTWTPDELKDLLGEETAKIAIAYFAMTPEGNFEHRNIPHTPRPDTVVAAELSLSVEALRSAIDGAKRKLYGARQVRPAPHVDDKILTAWNALMISAFAKGAQVLGDARHLATARATMDRLMAELPEDGRLRRTYKNGEARGPAFLEDYAFMIQAALDLYETSFDLSYLEQAIALEDVAARHFADPEGGGYFMTSDDHETLLVREKPAYDGATPSGNSVMVLNLLRLASLTDKPVYRERAELSLRAFHTTLARTPAALAEMLLAVEFYLSDPKQIVLVTPKSLAEAAPFLAQLHRRYLPNRVIAAIPEAGLADASKLVPLFRDRHAGADGPAVYICSGGRCDLPVSTIESFDRALTSG